MPLKIFLIILFFTSNLFAKSHMAFLGGGGEPSGDGTIFDYDATNVTKFLKQDTKWATTIAFNGGHKNTEKILAPLGNKSPVKNFTAENYQRIIEDYKKKINNGQITNGDQLIIYISSHGAQVKAGEKTHSISTSGKKAINMSTLQGSTTVSLDTLKSLSDLALKKGIKLGIIDMSCHSGASLPLANKNTCVISSTGPNHFGWAGSPTTFSAQFSKEMKSGKSLEEIFLKANASKTDISFPMISSEAGTKIQESIYREISPYLYDARSPTTKTKLDEYYRVEFNNNKCQVIDENYRDLISYMNQVQNITFNHNLMPLKKSLNEYYTLQKNIRSALKGKDSPPLNSQKNICNNDKKTCMSYTVFDYLQMDTTKSKKLLNDKIKTAPPAKIFAFNQQMDLLDQVDFFKKDFLKKYPEINKQTVVLTDNFIKNETYRLAKNVSSELQKIYPIFYKDIKKKKSSKSNPCSEIKF